MNWSFIPSRMPFCQFNNRPCPMIRAKLRVRVSFLCLHDRQHCTDLLDHTSTGPTRYRAFGSKRVKYPKFATSLGFVASRNNNIEFANTSRAKVSEKLFGEPPLPHFNRTLNHHVLLCQTEVPGHPAQDIGHHEFSWLNLHFPRCGTIPAPAVQTLQSAHLGPFDI